MFILHNTIFHLSSLVEILLVVLLKQVAVLRRLVTGNHGRILAKSQKGLWALHNCLLKEMNPTSLNEPGSKFFPVESPDERMQPSQHLGCSLV